MAPGSLSAQQSAQRSLKCALNVSASVSACTVYSFHSCDLLMCFLCRCAARGLWGTQALVLYCLLRAQQSRRRGVPGVLHQRARRWLHRSLQQPQPILPRPALQRQPQLHHWEHPAAHRQRCSMEILSMTAVHQPSTDETKSIHVVNRC